MKYLKKVLYINMSILFLPISCGPINNPEPSMTENLIMKDSYYYKYIYPNNSEARREDTKYYQFLLKKKYEVHNIVFFVAWEIDENSSEWTLTISNNSFVFEHEILFLLYNFDEDIFLSPEESVNEGILSIENLITSFKKMKEYIS